MDGIDGVPPPFRPRWLVRDIITGASYPAANADHAAVIINKIGWSVRVTPAMIYALKSGRGALRHRFAVGPTESVDKIDGFV